MQRNRWCMLLVPAWCRRRACSKRRLGSVSTSFLCCGFPLLRPAQTWMPTSVGMTSKAQPGTNYRRSARSHTRRVARPPSHHRQPQSCNCAALRFRQCGQGRGKQLARWHSAIEFAQCVGFAGRTQVAQETKRIGVEQPQLIDIGHRQRKTGTLQQPRAVPQVGEGETRGEAPPVSTASVSVKACRSSPRVPSAGRLASSNPPAAAHGATGSARPAGR